MRSVESNFKNAAYAYLILRLGTGLNFLMHGLMRMGDLPGFAEKASQGFTDTFLPQQLAYALLLAVPAVESISGLFVLIGFKTRLFLLVAGAEICLLITGTAIMQDWNTLGIQMIYLWIIYWLIKSETSDHICLDYYLSKKKS